MQWDETKHAGFSSGDTTWLPVNPNYHEINVKNALADQDSIFYTYQKLVQLRQTSEWLIDGDFELLDTSDKVFAYIRRTPSEAYLVVVNVSDVAQTFSFNGTYETIIISNHVVPTDLQQITLDAWDAFCVKLTK